jgi:hypothetical protein
MLEKKKYRVTLTDDEKELLQGIITKGKHGAQKRKRAQALLLTDAGYTDEANRRADRYAPPGDRGGTAKVCGRRV